MGTRVPGSHLQPTPFGDGRCTLFALERGRGTCCQLPSRAACGAWRRPDPGKQDSSGLSLTAPPTLAGGKSQTTPALHSSLTSDRQVQEAAWNNTEWDLYILQSFSMGLSPFLTMGCSLKLHGSLPPFPVPLT